jgi:RNA polymerase sigma factor (sigma-70 family)
MREPSGADGVLMSSAAGAHIHPRLGLRQSRRLLRLASDDRLVQQIQRGSEPAFEVAFERHSPAILGFCRHMLGSQEEAEDAVQHTFAAAYSDLQRGGEREIALKPWLFTIARNRCLSLLRARREHASAEPELLTTGLAEQVEQRAELRQLLADLRELPDEQREALLLAEAGGLPQADIAGILGCEVGRVKGLVYRARSGLLARREARELACEDVREQLANLRGGALRRNELRLHLRDCAGCRGYREQVRDQRKLLSVALPVVPTLGLKTNVLAAIGIGGAGGGAAAAGGAAVAGGAAGGATGAGALAGAAKVAAVAAVAIGGVGGGTAVVVSHHDSPAPRTPAASGTVKCSPAAADGPAATSNSRGQGAEGSDTPGGRQGAGGADGGTSHGRGNTQSEERSHGARGEAQREANANDHGGNGRGPIDTPAEDTPVRRGPPEEKVKPEHDHNAKVPEAETEGPTVKEQHAQQGDQDPEQVEHAKGKDGD